MSSIYQNMRSDPSDAGFGDPNDWGNNHNNHGRTPAGSHNDKERANMKQITGLDGPWNNKPLSGSVFWSEMAKDGKHVNRKHYQFSSDQHPAFTRFRRYVMSSLAPNKSLVDASGKPTKESAQYSDYLHGRSGGSTKRSKNKDTVAGEDNDDEDGPTVMDIEEHSKQKRKGPLLDLSEEALTQRATERRVDTDQSDDITPSMKAKVDNQPVQLVYYYMCLFVPQSYLRHNATHLGDFDTTRPEVKAFAHTWSFILASLANVSVASENEKYQTANIDPLYFIDPVANRPLPRLRTYVEVVLNTNEYNNNLPLDPPLASMLENMHVPDSYKLREICNPSNIAGYRIHYLIFDPKLHPSHCIKQRIFANQEERNIINRETYLYKIKCFLGDRERAEFMMKVYNGQLDDERMEEEKRKAAEENLMRASEAQSEDIADSDGEDEAEAGQGGMVPMTGSTKTNSSSNIDDIDNGNNNSRISIGGNSNNNNRSRKRKQVPSNIMDNSKLKRAEVTTEKLPYTFYRNVISLERYSTKVVHPYLKAANSPMALNHPNGIYTKDHTSDKLKDDAFDLCAGSQMLHPTNIFTFENSVRLAQLTLARNEGLQSPINSFQSDISNYFVTNMAFISFPFPHLVFEMNPRDLDPELNYMYKIPWHTSALDFKLDICETQLLNNAKRLQEMQAAGKDITNFVSSSTKIFEQTEGIKFHGLAEEGFINKIMAARKHQNGGSYEDEKLLDPVNPNKKVLVRRTQTHSISSISSEEAMDAFSMRKTQLGPVAPTLLTNGSMFTETHTDLLLGADLDKSNADVRYNLDRSKFRSEEEYQEALANEETEFSLEAIKKREARITANTKENLNTERFIASSRTLSAISKHGNAPKTLEELISQSKDKHGNLNLSQTFLDRVSKLFNSSKEEDRRILALIKRTANPALNDDLYNELQSGNSGGSGMINRTKNNASAEIDEELAEMEKKISSTLIEGCFAKQAKRMNQKLMRILSISSAMPCKTDEERCQAWLSEVGAQKDGNKTRRVKKVTTNPNTGEQIIKEVSVPVYLWTPELEETYRRDVLTRLMATFYEEALCDALSLMSLDNAELPEPHAGFILELERQQDKRFWVPKFTADQTMTRWGNAMALESMQLETICGVYQSHKMMLHLLHSFRYGVLKQNVAMRMHLLVRGAPGTEKSETLKRLMAMSISPTFLASDFSSKSAFMTANALDYVMKTHDEAPDWVCGDVSRMSREQRENRDRLKKILSSEEVAYQRNVENSNKKGKGAREMENFRVSHIHSMLAFCNEISPTNETSVHDRFRILALMPSKREDCTMGEKVVHSEFGNVDQNYQNQFATQKKIEHAVVGYLVTIQNCKGLPANNTDLLTVLMTSGCNELQPFYPKINERARASLRCKTETDTLIYSKMYDRIFCSEASPFIEWSEKKDRIENTTELHLMDMYKYFASGMFAEYDQCLWSMANFFEEQMSIRRFELILEAVSELCGWNRDFLLPSYIKYQIPLPDVVRRAYERGQTKEVYVPPRKVTKIVSNYVIDPQTGEHIQKDMEQEVEESEQWIKVGDPDQCSFIEEFHKFEMRLKALAATKRPKSPCFEFGAKVEFESMEDKFNRDALEKLRTRRKATNSNQKPSAQELAREKELEKRLESRFEEDGDEDDDNNQKHYAFKTHPTYLAVPGTDYQFAKQMLSIVQKYEENIDLNTVKMVLSELTKLTISVPVYKGCSNPKADTLEFEGTTLVDPANMNESEEDRKRGWKGRVHYEEVPVMEYKFIDPSNKAKGGIVRIASHFFMVPPHYLLYLFLSAHENRHTRNLSFPLPLTIRGYPSLMHRWDVKDRPGHILRISNPRYVPEDVRNLFTNSDIYRFSHAINTSSCMTPEKMAQRDTVQFVYDKEDLELTLYRDFLKNSYYSLPLKANTAWRQSRNPTTKFNLFVNQHYDRPGMVEEQIKQIRKYSFFTQSENFKNIRYPEDILRSMKRVVRVKKAQKLREQRIDQENLTRDEYLKFVETIRESHQLIPAPSDDIIETEEEFKSRTEENEKIEKTRDDFLLYLSFSRKNINSLTEEQKIQHNRLVKQYGKIDWVLEYLLLEVLESEEREWEEIVEKVQNYQLRTRSTFSVGQQATEKTKEGSKGSNKPSSKDLNLREKKMLEDIKKKHPEIEAILDTGGVVSSKNKPNPTQSAKKQNPTTKSSMSAATKILLAKFSDLDPSQFEDDSSDFHPPRTVIKKPTKIPVAPEPKVKSNQMNLGSKKAVIRLDSPLKPKNVNNENLEEMP